MHGCAYPRIRAAPANIARHGGIDFCIGRVGIFRQERRCGHNLTGLTVTALRHVRFQPGPLYGRQTLLVRLPFNGLNLLARHGGDRRDTGANRTTLQMHRAGAALGDATPELRANHIQLVPQHPQERRICSHY